MNEKSVEPVAALGEAPIPASMTHAYTAAQVASTSVSLLVIRAQRSVALDRLQEIFKQRALHP